MLHVDNIDGGGATEQFGRPAQNRVQTRGSSRSRHEKEKTATMGAHRTGLDQMMMMMMGRTNTLARQAYWWQTHRHTRSQMIAQMILTLDLMSSSKCLAVLHNVPVSCLLG